VVLDDGGAEVAARITAGRRQIAFYGSTPAYRPVLALHGWGELADRPLAPAGDDDDDATR
jgi:hypothetical protein